MAIWRYVALRRATSRYVWRWDALCVPYVSITPLPEVYVDATLKGHDGRLTRDTGRRPRRSRARNAHGIGITIRFTCLVL